MATVHINEQALDDKLSALEGARTWSSRVISKLETMIRTADDYDLFRINPVRYAKDKGMAENEAIDLFLYATKQGLFEMDWHLICPSCGMVVENFSQLGRVHSHMVCDICAVDLQVSLDDFIQVTFTIMSTIRDIAFHNPDSLSVEDLYFKYHRVKGMIAPSGTEVSDPGRGTGDLVLEYVEPGGKRTFPLNVTPGIFLIRDKGRGMPMAFTIQENPSAEAQQVQLQVKDKEFKVVNIPMPVGETVTGEFVHRAPSGQLQQGHVVLEVENHGETRCPLWVANFELNLSQRAVQFEPFLSGKRLLTTQTFRDLFRSEVVQSEEGIGVKDITFLFTDLKGSTALYDQIGDAKAYYLVRQHFDTLGSAVTHNNGAIVKTIGDAIMATFMNPVDAVNAGIEMLEGLKKFNQGISQKLYLKVGIHRGHSIVVTLNDRIDYFGQTVNIAARVQGLADANEIFLTQEVFDYAGISEVLTEHHVIQSEVDVKGVSGKLRVHKVSVST